MVQTLKLCELEVLLHARCPGSGTHRCWNKISAFSLSINFLDAVSRTSIAKDNADVLTLEEALVPPSGKTALDTCFAEGTKVLDCDAETAVPATPATPSSPCTRSTNANSLDGVVPILTAGQGSLEVFLNPVVGICDLSDADEPEALQAAEHLLISDLKMKQCNLLRSWNLRLRLKLFCRISQQRHHEAEAGRPESKSVPLSLLSANAESGKA